MSYPRTRAGTLIMPPNAAAAAGNSQATATLMPSNHVSVSGADGTKGVRLPEPSRGKLCLVYNEHATNGLVVYPHVGGDINDGTTDAGITIEGKSLAMFWALDLTTWASRFTANT